MKNNLLHVRWYFLLNFLLIHSIYYSNIYAQTYPPEIDASIITWEAYQTPSTVPNYLQSFTEPNSGNGNTVTRISDEAVFGCNCSKLRHRYAKNRPWNADETKIMTSGSPAKIIDAETYEVINEVSVKALWSNTNPDLTYDAAGNSTFVSKNIVTGQTTTLHQFSAYSSISVGYSEGNLSNDDRWVALIGVNGSNNTLIVYDIENDQIVGEWFKGTAGIDWISMSQSGDFVVVSYTVEGSGANRGIKSYDRNFNNETHLVNGHPHADLGYDTQGNEVLVHYGNTSGNYSIGYTRLDTGGTLGTFSFTGATGDRGLWGGHISTRNIDRPGWAYVSDQGHPTDVNRYEATREIFAIKLDGSNTIQRFAKHNTVTNSYYHQAHAVPNRDGTKVIFVSNWDNNTLESKTYAPMWVVEVPQNGSASVNAGEDRSICEGESVTLTASGVESYAWSTGQTTSEITVSPDTTTSYTVTGTDSEGNTSTDELIVTVHQLPTANAGNDVTICNNESTTLSASGGGTYQWNTGQTTQSITVSPNNDTTYTVTIIQNGCEATDSVNVTVNPLPSANAGEDITISQGESAMLTASGGDSYEWNTGETTQSIEVTPNETTTYTVFVASNGCEDLDEVTVTVNSGITANAGDDATICQGESTVLSASGGESYLWSTGETTQSISVHPIVTSNYTVLVSNEFSSDTDEVTVIVNPLPNVQVTDNVTILHGDFVTLSASGANSYLWNNGAIEPNIAVSPDVTTTYSVTGFINNCSETEEVTVNVVETVTAEAGPNETICFGDTITLTAAGGDDYLWNTGEVTQSITVNPSEETTYTVIVSNSLDSDADEVTISVENCNIEIPSEEPTYEYSLYSNPSNPEVIVVKLIGVEGDSELFIHDIRGKLIDQLRMSDNEGQEQNIPINTNYYEHGVYVITLKESNRITPKRVLFR